MMMLGCPGFNDGQNKGALTRAVEDLGKGIFGFVRAADRRVHLGCDLMCKGPSNVIRLFWVGCEDFTVRSRRNPFWLVAALWSFWRHPCGGE